MRESVAVAERLIGVNPNTTYSFSFLDASLGENTLRGEIACKSYASNGRKTYSSLLWVPISLKKTRSIIRYIAYPWQ